MKELCIDMYQMSFFKTWHIRVLIDSNFQVPQKIRKVKYKEYFKRQAIS